MKNSNEKTCENCGHLSPGGFGGECRSYTGPKSMQPVKYNDTCCKFATPLEVDVNSVCCTSADCAKYRIATMSAESLRACLGKESRATVRKMIETRLRKLEKEQTA